MEPPEFFLERDNSPLSRKKFKIFTSHKPEKEVEHEHGILHPTVNVGEVTRVSASS